MERAPVEIHRPWIPVALAVGIGAVMVLLATGPFELPESRRYAVEVPVIGLRQPTGTLDSFPARFEWDPVRDTVYYLVGVAELHDGKAEPVFRQRGDQPVLHVTFDAEHEPPPGRYAWEVLAFGAEGLPIARGTGSFVVR